MGAGKSTVGRVLANILSFDFQDTDHVIEQRTGADIPWIFDVEGEEGFRDRESIVLKELLEREQVVIATGGGVVVREENRGLLKNIGTTVYLTTDVKHLIARTTRDKKRPLLQVENPQQRVIDLFNERDPLYREIADYVIETDSQSPKSVADLVAKTIRTT